MKFIYKIILLAALFWVGSASAQGVVVNSFQSESYQKILTEYKNKPFMLVIWSVTCSACLSEMELIRKIQVQYSELNIVMLSVDGPEYFDEMKQIIKQEQLQDLKQWGFAQDNSPALRYTVDSRWYGELPRTYFFDAQHNKIGMSGVLSLEQYHQQIKLIQPKSIM